MSSRKNVQDGGGGGGGKSDFKEGKLGKVSSLIIKGVGGGVPCWELSTPLINFPKFLAFLAGKHSTPEA